MCTIMIIITFSIFRGAPTNWMIIMLGYESHACQHAAFLVISGHYKHASEERKQCEHKIKMKIVQDYSESSLLIKFLILLKTSLTLPKITRFTPFTDALLTTASGKCLLSFIRSQAVDIITGLGFYLRRLGGTPLGLSISPRSATITSLVTPTISRLHQWRHITTCGTDITLQSCCLCQSKFLPSVSMSEYWGSETLLRTGSSLSTWPGPAVAELLGLELTLLP